MGIMSSKERENPFVGGEKKASFGFTGLDARSSLFKGVRIGSWGVHGKENGGFGSKTIGVGDEEERKREVFGDKKKLVPHPYHSYASDNTSSKGNAFYLLSLS